MYEVQNLGLLVGDRNHLIIIVLTSTLPTGAGKQQIAQARRTPTLALTAVADSSTMALQPSPRPMEYPFATSPDILRTHQKDAYITGTLSTQASTIIRALLGARFAHKYADATNHLSELLYLCVTTLPGNRTLGEEYCDVIQVEDDTLRLAGLGRRVGYISSIIFAPWMLSKTLPALRRKLRNKLEWNLEHAKQRGKSAQTRALKIQEYILKHLDTFTSPNPIYALSLATFYFTGAYYQLSKRLFRLRYVFTKQIKPDEQRVGYEVLGVLLVLQMAVQTILHVRETYHEATAQTAMMGDAEQSATAIVGKGVEIPLGSTLGYSPTHLLADMDTPHKLPPGLSASTATPVLEGARYDLKDSEIMAWIPEDQQRKCRACFLKRYFH
ncbi:peroxisome biogenesis factor 10 [Exophiala sideris]|nr:peroxisome biogenesis factor 10 [Exophiala sideris]KAK5182422.1 peroxisome biogenesis factor 10 [Eurotiomycetes sp. CCFEE 6388]